MRQGVFVLRSAVYERARTQPVERVGAEGGTATGGRRIYRGAIAGPNGEFVCGPEREEDAVFRLAAGRGGGAGDQASKIYHIASAGLRKRHRGGDRGRAGDLRTRAPACAERVDGGVKGNGADIYAE